MKKNDVDDLARSTLESTLGRALSFLRGVGTSDVIRATLAAHGYDEEEHARGWALLHTVAGYEMRPAPAKTSGAETSVATAIAEIDAWDEPNLRIARAALTRLHPEAATFVLDGLEPAAGAAAVVGVKAFLDRLDALQKSPERKATREEDKAALDTLATRGIDANERARLRALVERAEGYTATDLGAERARAARQEAEDVALKELRVWYDDWAEMARALVKRREHLIRLGLAKRKSSKKAAAKPAAEPAKPSSPTPTTN